MTGTHPGTWLARRALAAGMPIIARQAGPGTRGKVAEPQLPEGGGLGVDSAGPEIFSSATPERGGGCSTPTTGATSMPAATTSCRARQRTAITARLTPLFDENTVDERRETCAAPLRKVGEMTLVRAIRY